GQNITTGSYTIRGTAHDYWSGVAQVEVSTDGVTWSPAQGTDNWTYQWSIPADNVYLVRARARDQAGNVETNGPFVKVFVSGGCSATTTTPGPSNTVVSTLTPANTPTATPPSTATPLPTDTTTDTPIPVPTETPANTATTTPIPCSINF